MVPTQTEKIGLRQVISKDEVDKVIEVLMEIRRKCLTGGVIARIE